MAIFNSYVTNYQRVMKMNCWGAGLWRRPWFKYFKTWLPQWPEWQLHPQMPKHNYVPTWIPKTYTHTIIWCCVYIKYVYIHTYIHNITLHYITLHTHIHTLHTYIHPCMHCIALHYNILYYIHYIYIYIPWWTIPVSISNGGANHSWIWLSPCEAKGRNLISAWVANRPRLCRVWLVE